MCASSLSTTSSSPEDISVTSKSMGENILHSPLVLCLSVSHVLPIYCKIRVLFFCVLLFSLLPLPMWAQTEGTAWSMIAEGDSNVGDMPGKNDPSKTFLHKHFETSLLFFPGTQKKVYVYVIAYIHARLHTTGESPHFTWALKKFFFYERAKKRGQRFFLYQVFRLFQVLFFSPNKIILLWIFFIH